MFSSLAFGVIDGGETPEGNEVTPRAVPVVLLKAPVVLAIVVPLGAPPATLRATALSDELAKDTPAEGTLDIFTATPKQPQFLKFNNDF